MFVFAYNPMEHNEDIVSACDESDCDILYYKREKVFSII